MLLFTAVFGVIEFGWLLFNYHEVTNAAREGARYASVHGTWSKGYTSPSDIANYQIDPATVKAAVLKTVNLQSPDALTVTVTDPDGDYAPNHRVTVSVTYPYRPIIAFIIPTPTLNLSASSTMIIHY